MVRPDDVLLLGPLVPPAQQDDDGRTMPSHVKAISCSLILAQFHHAMTD